MKQNGAFMPQRAPQLWGSKGARIQQRNYHHSCWSTLFCIFILYFLSFGVLSDDIVSDTSSNGYTLEAEPSTTTEFDYASRGSKKFGDKCESTIECGFPGSVCDGPMKTCHCVEDLPITNHIDKCGKEVVINDTCFFNEQCESFHFQTICRNGRCSCLFDMTPILNKDGTMDCIVKQESREPERYIDPAMIGILAGMALMFIIICVVLRLFSRARWRENRTIFNTPNPRLMNVSLLRDNKLLHSQERRGSRMSVRMPSRQPSMASLRPHSPNPSLGSRRGSHGSSNASATSTRSNRSGNNGNNPSGHEYKSVKTHIINNPAVENITVEVIEPKA